MTSAAIGSIQVEVDGQGEPAAFVHGFGGTSSIFAPARRLRAGLKDARLKIFERRGHWSSLERSRECGNAASEFMRAHVSGQG